MQWAWGARGEGRRWKGKQPDDGLGRSARGRGLLEQLQELGGPRATRDGSFGCSSGATTGCAVLAAVRSMAMSGLRALSGPG